MKEIKYVEIDGVLYPDLRLTPQKQVHLSRFGRMKLKHLKEHRQVQYTNLFMSGELNNYLQELDDEMKELYNRLIEQYKVEWNITEELKEKDQMKWVQELNNIRVTVEEYLINEIMNM
ncbi:MAG: TnpV protein [Beduini sp.]|uniref:TnpV protein n=1 Tax=Beduini sp. TaxID=1922300 RepID=UPI0039A14BDF